MSNLHRIQWIDAQIRAERFPNCSTIARKFEITRRQASRDIEYLRYSLGAPVEPKVKTLEVKGVSMDRKNIVDKDETLDEAIQKLVDNLAKDGMLR